MNFLGEKLVSVRILCVGLRCWSVALTGAGCSCCCCSCCSYQSKVDASLKLLKVEKYMLSISSTINRFHQIADVNDDDNDDDDGGDDNGI